MIGHSCFLVRILSVMLFRYIEQGRLEGTLRSIVAFHRHPQGVLVLARFASHGHRQWVLISSKTVSISVISRSHHTNTHCHGLVTLLSNLLINVTVEQACLLLEVHTIHCCGGIIGQF